MQEEILNQNAETQGAIDWKEVIACAPLVLLAIPSSYGVGRFFNLIDPDIVSWMAGAAFESAYLGAITFRERRSQSKFITVIVMAVAASITFNVMDAALELRLLREGHFDWVGWMLSAFLGVFLPLVNLAYAFLMHDKTPKVAATITANPEQQNQINAMQSKLEKIEQDTKKRDEEYRETHSQILGKLSDLATRLSQPVVQHTAGLMMGHAMPTNTPITALKSPVSLNDFLNDLELELPPVANPANVEVVHVPTISEEAYQPQPTSGTFEEDSNEVGTFSPIRGGTYATNPNVPRTTSVPVTGGGTFNPLFNSLGNSVPTYHPAPAQNSLPQTYQPTEATNAANLNQYVWPTALQPNTVGTMALAGNIQPAVDEKEVVHKDASEESQPMGSRIIQFPGASHYPQPKRVPSDYRSSGTYQASVPANPVGGNQGGTPQLGANEQGGMRTNTVKGGAYQPIPQGGTSEVVRTESAYQSVELNGTCTTTKAESVYQPANESGTCTTPATEATYQKGNQDGTCTTLEIEAGTCTTSEFDNESQSGTLPEEGVESGTPESGTCTTFTDTEASLVFGFFTTEQVAILDKECSTREKATLLWGNGEWKEKAKRWKLALDATRGGDTSLVEKLRKAR